MSSGIINRNLMSALRSFRLLRSSSSDIGSCTYFLRTLHKLSHVDQNSAFKRITSCNFSCNKPFSSTSIKQNSSSLDINYDDVVKVQKDDKTLIIDVREQKEIDETGKLPGSVHIPMGNVATNLTSMSDQEFKSNYGKNKPNYETPIVLSCRSGKRSKMVQEELQKLGFKNTMNYAGGWLDWEEKTKK